MTSRREFLIGGACALTAGAAYAATPRERMSLLGKAKLEDLIPRSFGAWAELPSDSVVVPQSDDSLAARLYAQTVSRVFVNQSDGTGVMALFAYGDTQSDQLQLHRPEVCYPAFGFAVIESKAVDIGLAKGAVIPARQLTAQSALRTEHVAYWTRIGEYLPQSGEDQRVAKLRTAFQGIIPDGILVRVSNLEATPNAGFAVNQRFVAQLIEAMPRQGLPALVGTRVAQQLAR
ncbi:MAG: exosortase-associated protein EpsI, V-type [Pseudomonadota bacterium]